MEDSVATLNSFDIFVLVVTVLSAVIAFFRGFIRELLSLAAWGGSALLAYYTYPLLVPVITPHLDSETLARAVSVVAIYILALLVISIINHQINRKVRELDLKPVDRSLGFLFGLLRGAFIISLMYLVFSATLAGDEEPKWAKESQTGRLVSIGSAYLAELAPALTKDLEKLSSSIKSDEDGPSAPVLPEGAREVLDELERIAGAEVSTKLPVLNEEQEALLDKVIMAIPPTQRPAIAADNPTDRERAAHFMNMIRLYKQLQVKSPAPTGDINPVRLEALEDILQTRYGEAARKDADAPATEDDTLRNHKQEELQRLLESFQ